MSVALFVYEGVIFKHSEFRVAGGLCSLFRPFLGSFYDCSRCPDGREKNAATGKGTSAIRSPVVINEDLLCTDYGKWSELPGTSYPEGVTGQ